MEWFTLRGRPTSGWTQWLLLLLAGLLVSIFAAVITNITPVGALDATWNNQALNYNGNDYTRIDNNDDIKALGLPEGSTVYSYVRDNNGNREVKVIQFAPGNDMTTANSATYREYNHTPPDTYTETTSRGITTEPASEHNNADPEGCNVAGIGYLVCPFTREMSKGMDWLYDKLTGFLEAQPLNVNNTNSGLYVAWNIMRSFANAVFIVGFIILIYSHLTSVGLSNYGIKKLLPRLIITAILVNVSFYICAIAIDLSNIAGYGLQDIFIAIRNSVTTLGEGQISNTYSWESVTGAILAGSAVAGAGGLSAALAFSELGGQVIWLLLPLLVGLLITVIVVLLILAARQALIVILTIISPLALVSYLLPGTEKWFEMWRNFFFTMLLFFPAFSAVFGGSQLAAATIIQNSSSIIMTILGLGVQVAPLAIAPLIFKLSGGVLNRFAGIINNPSKGLIDRTRNFANDQAKYMANKRIFGNNDLEGRHFMRRAARGMNRRLRRRSSMIENYQQKADAAWQQTEAYKQLDFRKRETEQDAQLTKHKLETDWNKHLMNDGRALERDLKLRVVLDEESLSNAKLDNRYAQLKTGHLPPGVGTGSASMVDIMNRSQDVTKHVAAQGLLANTASRKLNEQIAENMLKSNDMQLEAAGAYGSPGVDAALASSISTVRSEYGRSVEEGRQIIKHFNLSSDKKQDHAMGVTFTAYDSSGNSRTFDSSNIFTREAAIEDQMATGTADHVTQLIAASGSQLSEFRTTIASSYPSSSARDKAPFLSSSMIDDIAMGQIANMADFENKVARWVKGGKFQPLKLSKMDIDSINILENAINHAGAYISPSERRALRVQIDKVLTDKELTANLAKNAEDGLKNLKSIL